MGNNRNKELSSGAPTSIIRNDLKQTRTRKLHKKNKAQEEKIKGENELKREEQWKKTEKEEAVNQLMKGRGLPVEKDEKVGGWTCKRNKWMTDE